MSETCENCGRVLDNFIATHCSEECLLSSIQNSKTLLEYSEFDGLIGRLR